MKEEVILRFLKQGSPKLELQLRRYSKNNFRDLFVISRKWLGVFLEIFLNSRVPVGILVDRGMISDKCRGSLQCGREFWLGIYFFNRKYRSGPGPRHVDGAAWLGSTVDRGSVAKRACVIP
jgi:hypothetical protein